MTAAYSLRVLMAANRSEFYTIAFGLLSQVSEPDNRSRSLSKFLVGDDLFLDLLESESAKINKMTDVVRTARHLVSADSSFAQSLVSRLNKALNEGDSERAERLLAVTEGIYDSANMLMSLVSLTKVPEGRIRSKAMLLVGKISPQFEWLRHALEDPDPRVRSNAIESIWDNPSAEVCAIIRPMVEDPQQRVVANTLLALLRGGDPEAPDLLEQMGRSESKHFRASAAWAMGKTGDIRFKLALNVLLKDKEPIVFRNALRALIALRKVAGTEISEVSDTPESL
jgi:HEAT repeat protein